MKVFTRVVLIVISLVFFYAIYAFVATILGFIYTMSKISNINPLVLNGVPAIIALIPAVSFYLANKDRSLKNSSLYFILIVSVVIIIALIWFFSLIFGGLS